jgi:SAM-dependent methyltransferase
VQPSRNIDPETVEGFGEEWLRFDQSEGLEREHARLFEHYFAIFPWASIAPNAIGFDVGCGSGRWARFVAPRVGRLQCVDASEKALGVARRNLAGNANCDFFHASVSDLPFGDGTMDFGYSLGVLHHVPDTLAGILACVRALKPGAPLLLYLYYAFDTRPFWYRWIWRASDLVRRFIARLPSKLKAALTDVIAAAVYWPLATASALLERAGADVTNVPLSFYRDKSFYTMRTDALDRFGTRLEQRFTAKQIRAMMEQAGLSRIQFYDGDPRWCAIGWKRVDELP